ncbi:GNAT family N-acetyltransferase [Shewanella colwelliana]|uniref:GNAT family N-acetyltransferase n=1 Tax=Shewanella colwelliana TaxID=23 RepID=UPI0022AF97B9|nr:GNAT family N-acetyltransferase [Shewanella colwelliana]MCZ4336608.1 GNAT family N-acetyltransferase [Shewanella colwelliana]
MLIRIAIEEDLSVLAAQFDLYRQSLGQLPAPDDSKDFIQSRLQENDSVIFIAQLENEILGFIQLYPSFSSRLLKPLWYFDDIFVVKSQRNKGIATALIHKAKELADETNVLAVRREHLDEDGFLMIDNDDSKSAFASFSRTAVI